MEPRVTIIGRAIAAAAGVVLAISAGVSGAFAHAPDRAFLPAPDVIDFAAGEVCAFPTRIEILENREYGTTFTSHLGATYMLVSGRLVARETNMANGKWSLDNVSGPGRFDFAADGSSATTFYGNALVWYPGHLYRVSGHFVQFADADGNIVSVSDMQGHVEDLCVTLG